MASGLGVAACMARDPTPVNHMRPWNWVRKGREMKGAGGGVFGFVPNFKTTGSAKTLSVQLFFILVYVPKLLRVFIHLDYGYRRVNMLLNIACNLR